MKMLSDFLALILFFAVYGIAYKIDPKQAIYYATAVAITVAIIQIIYAKIRKRKMDMTQKINHTVIIVFGITGIVMNNPLFFYWKPTIISWIMAIALGVSHLLKKNALKLSLKDKITLPEFAWARLTYAWIAFFIILGTINILVAFNFDEAIWVKYKVFGSFALVLVFVLAQGAYLGRFVEEEKSKD